MRWTIIKCCTIFILGALSSIAIAASVTLAWCPNPEPDLGGYFLHMGEGVVTNWAPEKIILSDTNDPCSTFTKISSGSNWFRAYTKKIAVATNQVTVAGLENGKTYFFAVTATNTSGIESTFSNEIRYEVPIVSKPDAPLPQVNFRIVPPPE